ncbi:MAG: helix-turn-helix domain-containing protein [Coleofasciculus sp. Co-bin14]|nr:helix-turn-helix domain-containing protein [Coleofasciculus sp. Co-bin14]
MPKKPRPIGEREQNLIHLYSYCQLRMTPQQFYAKWGVKHEAIALIGSRSITTVGRWFSRGKTHRRPMPNDLHHLALMDFLLEHYEEIPEKLRKLLCPSNWNP